MSRRPPLLYASDGNTPLVADDSEDKLRALCLAAFGALKGIMKDANGRTSAVEGAHLERWQEYVASKIFDVVGQDAIERFWNVKLAAGPVPNLGRGPEGVQ